MPTTHARPGAETEGPQQRQRQVKDAGIGESYEADRAGVESIVALPARHGATPSAMRAVLQLQRACGNQAVQRLIAGRRQAATADRAVRLALVQRTGGEEEEPVQTLSVQRAPGDEEEEVQTLPLQRQGEEEELQTLRVQRKGGEEEEPVQELSLQRQGEEEEIQTLRVQRAVPVQRDTRYTYRPTGIDWGAISAISPSKEGAMGGVMFAKVGAAVQHVIKAQMGSAGAVLFGEQIVKKTAGAATTDSKPIPKGTDEFKLIVARLQEFHRQADQGDDADVKARWATNLPFFEGADFLMIQKPMSGHEIGDVKKGEVAGQDVTTLLRDADLLRQIGRTLVGDSLIGNADRFESMNMGNAFLTAAHQVGAIDTEAIMQSLEGYGVSRKGWANPENWAKLLVSTGGEKMGSEEKHAGAPSSKLAILDADKFNEWFHYDFMGAISRDGNNQQLIARAMFAPENRLPHWVQIKAWIREGVDQALRDANASFKGQGYREAKHEIRELEQEYGKDVNFDVGAFKVRAAYLRALSEGRGGKQAEKTAVGWAEFMGNVAPLGREITTVQYRAADVPAGPQALTAGQKLGRGLSTTGEALTARLGKVLGSKEAAERAKQKLKTKAEAKANKERLRKGELSPEKALEPPADVSDRRTWKVRYEASYQLFADHLRGRAEKMERFAKLVAPYVATTDAQLKKKVTKLLAQVDAAVTAYHDVVVAWGSSLEATGEKKYVTEMKPALEQLDQQLREARAKVPSAPR